MPNISDAAEQPRSKSLFYESVFSTGKFTSGETQDLHFERKTLWWCPCSGAAEIERWTSETFTACPCPCPCPSSPLTSVNFVNSLATATASFRCSTLELKTVKPSQLLCQIHPWQIYPHPFKSTLVHDGLSAWSKFIPQHSRRISPFPGAQHRKGLGSGLVKPKNLLIFVFGHFLGGGYYSYFTGGDSNPAKHYVDKLWPQEIKGQIDSQIQDITSGQFVALTRWIFWICRYFLLNLWAIFFNFSRYYVRTVCRTSAFTRSGGQTPDALCLKSFSSRLNTANWWPFQDWTSLNPFHVLSWTLHFIDGCFKIEHP